MPFKILNVAEKPSVAKEITAILSRGGAQKRTGFSKYNPIFEFPFQYQNQNADIVFTSVAGHLMGLDYPDPYRNWSSNEPITLFDAPVVKSLTQGMEDIAKTLKKESKGARILALWLDCDREGENIAFEVVRICQEANPQLQILRARFAAVIPKEIYRAWNNLVPPNLNESLAVDARQEIDLRIGAVFTRFQTMRLQNKYEGPCQFPTLGFVVDRFRRIENFIPEAFWYIEVSLERDGLTANFNWQRDRLYDRLSVLVLYEMCIEQPIAKVIDCEAKPKKKFRPAPLNTVQLQMLASKKLHMSSETTMKVAEALYQAGYISYPRTETDSFDKSFDFKSYIEEQSRDSNWGSFAGGLVNDGRFKFPKDGKNNDNAHPPIFPAKYTNNLQGPEKQLYELVVRHFLACCAEDAVGKETIVTIDIAGEIFTTKGLIVEQLNYLEVYPYEKWTDKTIPIFVENESFTPTTLLMREGKTTAPELISESELIKLMDENGIGTDATIATHIQTIQERGYVFKKMPGSFFTPTTLGIALVDGYNAMGLEYISQPQLRAEMEAAMTCICKGTKSKEEVIQDAVSKYKEIFTKVMREAEKLDEAMDKHFNKAGTSFLSEEKNFSECGKCHKSMSLRTSENESRVLFCATCDQSFSLPRQGNLVPHDHRCPLCNFQVIIVQKQETSYNLCPHCRNSPPPDAQSSKGMFNCFNCSANCPLATKRTETPVRLCPQCRSNQLMVRKKKDGSGFFLGCKGYPTCKCTMSLPRGVTELTVLDDICDLCLPREIHRIKFQFKRSVLPIGMSTEYIGCIGGCDQLIREFLEQDNSQNLSIFFNSEIGVNIPNVQRPNPTFLNQSYQQLNSGINNSFQNSNFRSNSTNSNLKSSNNFQANSFQSDVDFDIPDSSMNDFPANNQDQNQDSDLPNCPGHNLPCNKLTTKQGPNTGRPFYACSLPRGQQCEFFQWADVPPQPSGGGSHFNKQNFQKSNFSKNSFNKSNNNFSGSGGGSSMSGVVCYRCNEPGHFANACPNSSNSNSKSSASPNSKSFSKKQGMKSNKWSPDGPPVKRAKKCSVCHQEGHTKKKHEKDNN